MKKLINKYEGWIVFIACLLLASWVQSGLSAGMR